MNKNQSERTGNSEEGKQLLTGWSDGPLKKEAPVQRLEGGNGMILTDI